MGIKETYMQLQYSIFYEQCTCKSDTIIKVNKPKSLNPTTSAYASNISVSR